ncbi:MAG: cellulase family glycosylhydrolase, partial [Aggregatilineales bacterium]
IYVENLQLRPTDNGLRVRSLPDVIRGKELRQIHRADTVETREFHGRMLSKVGKQGNWLSIKVPGAERGYVAAWFMEAETPRPDQFSGVNITGVNLDAFHHLGTPNPNWLGNIGWVRFGYNVSAGTGSEDIQAAYDRYAPLFDAYVRAGYRVCVTTSHQTYGEAKAEFPLNRMNDGQWQTLIARKADMMSRIAQQWSGKGLINCWQIWNEPDAVIGAEASIAMPPHIYRLMLAGIIPAMRATDPQAYIVTAGFTGSQMGSNYARQAIAGLPTNALPEAIALHPYGLTARGSNDPFGFFGSIDSALTDYGSVMPDKKLWITEWGVNRNEDRPPQEIGDYAMAMVNHINAYYRAQIAALIWYPWAQGMHSAYGIVDNQSQSRPGLTDRFLNA